MDTSYERTGSVSISTTTSWKSKTTAVGFAKNTLTNFVFDLPSTTTIIQERSGVCSVRIVITGSWEDIETLTSCGEWLRTWTKALAGTYQYEGLNANERKNNG